MRLRHRLSRSVLDVAGVLVPSCRRAAWREEWEAELWHRQERHERSGSRRVVADIDLFLRSAGAVPHAIWEALRSIDDLLADARVALRGFLKSPVTSGATILTLAMGIGGTVAIFSVLNAVLLKPLPYDDPDKLVGIWQTARGVGQGRFPLSPATYFTYRDETEALEAVGMWDNKRVTLTGLDEPERVDVVLMTEEVFTLLGYETAVGRLFTRDDMSASAPATVVLAYGYWQRRFGADAGVIGRTLEINGEPAEIIGVMQRDVWFPEFEPAAFLPARFELSDVYVGYYSFRGLGRLRAGRTVEDANHEAARVIPLAIERFGGTTQEEALDMELGTLVTPLKEDVVGDVGALLWILLGTVGLVLLIAGANVANLLLVRAEARQREMAVRMALGASRARLARYFMAESLTLGIVGGALGLGLAYGGMRLLVRWAPPDLPRVDEISVDPTVLLFTLGMSLLAGLLFGLVPTLVFCSDGEIPGLKEAGRGVGARGSRHRFRNTLAVAEVAVALVLLVGAGLMVRTIRELRSVEPGFQRPEEVLTARTWVPDFEIAEPQEVAGLEERLMERIAAVPGVATVGAASSVGMDNWVYVNQVHVRDQPVPEDMAAPSRRLNWIAGDYFAALETPLLAGRTITWDDIRAGSPVVVVSASFAREYWPIPARALGNRIGFDRSGPWLEIVGVVDDIRATGVDEPAPPFVYLPLLLNIEGRTIVQRDMRFAIRAAGRDPKGLLPELREAVQAVLPTLPLTEIETLEEILARSLARTSFALVLLGVAAGVAVLLGCIGVYGVISYVVALRSREFGIRIALGATRLDVMRLVTSQAGFVTLAGILIGVAAAAALTRLMSALLFGVSPVDAPTYLIVAAGLGAVALMASYIPARRAACVSPSEALRWE